MDNAELYASASSMQRTDAERILRDKLPIILLPEGSRILDIGCGSGEVTANVLMPMLPSGTRHASFLTKIELGRIANSVCCCC